MAACRDGSGGRVVIDISGGLGLTRQIFQWPVHRKVGPCQVYNYQRFKVCFFSSYFHHNESNIFSVEHKAGWYRSVILLPSQHSTVKSRFELISTILHKRYNQTKSLCACTRLWYIKQHVNTLLVSKIIIELITLFCDIL